VSPIAGPFNQPLAHPTRYWPGGMAKEVSLGGRQTHENITLSREFDWGRDLPSLSYLLGRRGKGTVTIGQQFLDVDGNAQGNPLTATGTLKSVQAPDHDSTGNDAAMIELECTIVSLVAT
jgi:hypothetical protein